MPPLAIFSDTLLTPLEAIANAVVIVENERILAAGPRDSITVPKSARELRAGGKILAPGFVDAHIHGAGGCDVMDADASALSTIAKTLARFGTTCFVPTTMTAAPDPTAAALERISNYIRASASSSIPDAPAAQPVGIHLEGPFISGRRKGVHPAEWIALPSRGLLNRFALAARGAVKLLTLAPELPGGLDLVAAARSQNIAVSLGHTDATFDQATAAIARGATHAAHVFNAMRPFSHRETGVVGAVLTSPQVTAELIADGVHVDPAAMRILLAAKQAAGTVLVSDGTAATGMPDGAYRLGTFEVTVTGGVCRNAEGRLAGSTLTLDRAVRTMTGLGVSLKDAVQMATLNPARILNLQEKKGVIAPGADADLVLLDANLSLAGVMTRGCGLGALKF